MITQLSGVLLAKNPPHIVLYVGGVGYEIALPLNLFEKLPPLNQTLKVLTHLQIKEDSHSLYGFLDETTRAAFRALLKINGIGARSALAILSNITPVDLLNIVQSKNAQKFTKIPGIGKKTAERLLLELDGKLNFITLDSNFTPDPANDLLNALLALGYSEKESLLAIKDFPNDLPLNAAIKRALQALSRF